MSSSCDDIADGANPLVKTFLYPETFGDPTGSGPPVAYLGELARGQSGSERDSLTSPEDISRLLAEARAEGLAEGSRQAGTRLEEELARERKRLAALVLDFERQRADYYSKVEVELVHLSLAIAAKILHRESQVDRMVVAGLVKVMLERFHQNTRVVVRVRPEDEKSWAHYFQDHANVEVIGDSALEPKACLIETELGVANMSLDAQLKEVEQGFFDLLAKRPDAK
jgi:flagellar assembly protein FliH